LWTEWFYRLLDDPVQGRGPWDLELLSELIEAGKVRPQIDRRSRFSEIPAAIAYLEQGRQCVPAATAEAPGSAHIVTTAAGAGLVPAPPGTNLGLYAATKRAVVGYSETLREELEPEGIGVSVLCPSGIVGNLSETSERSRRRYLGASADPPGGKPPSHRRLVRNKSIGPLVVEAMLVVGTLMNLASRSRLERLIQTPIAALLSVLCLIVALD
jgi:NAD(P)-dependent dehydrogenase (short-subunit alcohol dehydrogenase family)